MFLLFMILLISQLLFTRYKTILMYNDSTKSAYYCEMFIFRNVTKEKTIDTSKEDEEEIEEGNDIIIKENQSMTFKNCKIELQFEEELIYANYQSEDVSHGLRITMNQDQTEILDVAYEY